MIILHHLFLVLCSGVLFCGRQELRLGTLGGDVDGYFKWRIIIVVSFLSQSNLWLTSGCGGSAAHPVSTVISSYSPAEAFLRASRPRSTRDRICTGQMICVHKLASVRSLTVHLVPLHICMNISNSRNRTEILPVAKFKLGRWNTSTPSRPS